MTAGAPKLWLDESAAEVLSEMLHWWKAQSPSASRKLPQWHPPQISPGPDSQMVRVSSATPTSGLFPGQIQKVDASTSPPTLTDLNGSQDCWAWAPNGETLSTQKYPCARRRGNKDTSLAGLPIFEVTAGGGTFSGTVVTNVTCNSGTLSVTSKTLALTGCTGTLT
jgi:hypothetical protein